ncbi:MAG: selenoneine synthase SenA [Rhodospirillales bacterium]
MTASVATTDLIELLHDARSRTLELVTDLSDEQLIPPKLETVNPLLWEIGHVAYFYEYFILRKLYGYEPIIGNADEIYDSINIPHDVRWDLPVLSREETHQYLENVLNALVDRLEGDAASEQDSFIYQFGAFHEGMHDEAFLWARQTFGYQTPVLKNTIANSGSGGALDGFADVPGGEWMLGSPKDAAFLFDNEKWAHPVNVAPFQISRSAVTNAEFVAFVEDSGYQRNEFWSDEGWQWRKKTGAEHPVYWRTEGPLSWSERHFDQWRPLSPDNAVIHVCAYEADAYCRWAGVRLPSETEWEVACLALPDGDGFTDDGRTYPWGKEKPAAAQANLDAVRLGTIDVGALTDGDSPFGCRQMIGNVWEWTASPFGPFPGFAPDSYEDYSQPLFGDTRVLRGGAWTTRSHYVNGKYRNYFEPHRRDVFAGFRVCKDA